MIVTDDENVDRVTNTIIERGRTGHFGDGKIFITPVEETYTIRTGAKGV
jgi:nitrogen regulatory protein PII 1